MDKKDLVQRVSEQVGKDKKTVEEIVDATLEEIYQSLRRSESVSLRNFGTFHIRKEGRDAHSIFKFNPSQRLRQIFGWSSTYKGDL